MDVVFYGNSEVRSKRQEFLTALTNAAGRDLTPQEIDRCKDLLAEMLAKMGRELSLEFDHTEIKDTGYYPVAFEQSTQAIVSLREKGLAVLEGRANIGVVLKEEPTPHSTIPPGAIRRSGG